MDVDCIKVPSKSDSADTKQVIQETLFDEGLRIAQQYGMADFAEELQGLKHVTDHETEDEDSDERDDTRGDDTEGKASDETQGKVCDDLEDNGGRHEQWNKIDNEKNVISSENENSPLKVNGQSHQNVESKSMIVIEPIDKS